LERSIFVDRHLIFSQDIQNEQEKVPLFYFFCDSRLKFRLGRIRNGNMRTRTLGTAQPTVRAKTIAPTTPQVIATGTTHPPTALKLGLVQSVSSYRKTTERDRGETCCSATIFPQSVVLSGSTVTLEKMPTMQESSENNNVDEIVLSPVSDNTEGSLVMYKTVPGSMEIHLELLTVMLPDKVSVEPLLITKEPLIRVRVSSVALPD
jgi:hypothetical protein